MHPYQVAGLCIVGFFSLMMFMYVGINWDDIKEARDLRQFDVKEARKRLITERERSERADKEMVRHQMKEAIKELSSSGRYEFRDDRIKDWLHSKGFTVVRKEDGRSFMSEKWIATVPAWTEKELSDLIVK